MEHIANNCDEKQTPQRSRVGGFNRKNQPSIDELRKHLRYEPSTGDFYWIEPTSSRTKAGSKAGYIRPDGYVRIGLNRRLHLAHRIAWAMTYSDWPMHEIDHINGDCGDNRISNLRLASRIDNARNVRRRKNNRSGYKGVVYRNGKWDASIRTGVKRLRLGLFQDPVQAHEAYCAAAARHHGDFARFK